MSKDSYQVIQAARVAILDSTEWDPHKMKLYDAYQGLVLSFFTPKQVADAEETVLMRHGYTWNPDSNSFTKD